VTGAPALSGRLAMRLYFGESGGVTALREARAFRLLAAGKYPVPPLILVEPSARPLGRPFLIMQYIQGDLLGKFLRTSDRADLGATLDRFSGLLARLHALPLPTPDGNHDLPVVSVAGQVEGMAAYAKRFPSRSSANALHWLERTVGQVAVAPLSLIHFDFHPHNVLIDADGQPWVIDWTQAQITDARLDLAWTLILMASYEGWSVAEDIRTRYAAAAGAHYRGEEMPFFEAFASARRVLSVLIAMEHGAEALGMRPGAETVMAQTLDPIRAVYAHWLALTGVGMPEVEDRLASLA
jgi:aminoglycoside phosphotransferase (APT) family kinase protein